VAALTDAAQGEGWFDRSCLARADVMFPLVRRSLAAGEGMAAKANKQTCFTSVQTTVDTVKH